MLLRSLLLLLLMVLHLRKCWTNDANEKAPLYMFTTAKDLSELNLGVTAGQYNINRLSFGMN